MSESTGFHVSTALPLTHSVSHTLFFGLNAWKYVPPWCVKYCPFPNIFHRHLLQSVTRQFLINSFYLLWVVIIFSLLLIFPNFLVISFLSYEFVFILLMSIKCIQRDSKIVLWVLVDLVYLVVVWYMECTYEDTPIVVRRFNVVETISNLLLVSFQYIFYTLHSVTKHRYPKQCKSSYMHFWKLVFYRTSNWVAAVHNQEI